VIFFLNNSGGNESLNSAQSAQSINYVSVNASNNAYCN